MLLLRNNQNAESKMLKMAFSMQCRAFYHYVNIIANVFTTQAFYFGAFHYEIHVWQIKITHFVVG